MAETDEDELARIEQGRKLFSASMPVYRWRHDRRSVAADAFT